MIAAISQAARPSTTGTQLKKMEEVIKEQNLGGVIEEEEENSGESN